ncbi:hypothetical protein ACFFP0_13660 [Rhizobium puerariae]|uniref:Inorganic pyrophosphatase n=1 Tax=Rhizobium puerariae TaxID=1585791 RepID=A0ABV6AH00_9HYPH
MQNEDAAFWETLEALIATTELTIDRPAGSRHPRYPDLVYPLDYGFLDGTTSMDGGGIDVWRGSLRPAALVAIALTVDLAKKDSEIKLLLGCTAGEIETVRRFHNEHAAMKAIVLRAPCARMDT